MGGYLQESLLLGQPVPLQPLLGEPDLHGRPLVLHHLTGLWQGVHAVSVPLSGATVRL